MRKTDDNDLEAIFHAAVKGYGLATLPVGEVYQSLQAVSRHRHNLVKQRARLMVQIRRLLHQTMPGFADLFEDGKLFHKSIALPVALKFSFRRSDSTRGSWRNREPSQQDESALPNAHDRTHRGLGQHGRRAIGTRRDAHATVATAQRSPPIVRRSNCGNGARNGRFSRENAVYSPPQRDRHQCRLGGATGRRSRTDRTLRIGTRDQRRAGLFPSRYQSDEVDHADGSLVRQCNRKLRGAAMLVAENLIKCHPYYRGLSALWTQQKVDPRDRRCRIANRAMRMVYQLVGGRQLWRGKGVDREYLLAKLQEFHRVHKTPIDQSIRDMNEAFAWLPKSAYEAEAKPLAELARKKHRGPIRIGDLLIPLLIRLGVSIEEEVESNTSEARSSA